MKIFRVALILFFLQVIACQTYRSKKSLERELDEYYDKYGNDITGLFNWINANVSQDSGYEISHRRSANEVFCQYLDSTNSGENYFEFQKTMPKNYLDVLSNLYMGSVVKFRNSRIFEMDISLFQTSGYYVKIIYFGGTEIHYDSMPNFNELINNFSDEYSRNWLYKKNIRFFFLISKKES